MESRRHRQGPVRPPPAQSQRVDRETMTRSLATGPSPWTLLSRAGALWLGTVLGVLGVVFAIIGVRDAYTERQYHSQGLTVAATMTDKSIERAKRGGNSRTRYLVSYHFTSS